MRKGSPVSEPLMRMQLRPSPAQALFGYWRLFPGRASHESCVCRAVKAILNWDKSGQAASWSRKNVSLFLEISISFRIFVVEMQIDILT